MCDKLSNGPSFIDHILGCFTLEELKNAEAFARNHASTMTLGHIIQQVDLCEKNKKERTIFATNCKCKSFVMNEDILACFPRSVLENAAIFARKNGQYWTCATILKTIDLFEKNAEIDRRNAEKKAGDEGGKS